MGGTARAIKSLGDAHVLNSISLHACVGQWTGFFYIWCYTFVVYVLFYFQTENVCFVFKEILQCFLT